MPLPILSRENERHTPVVLLVGFPFSIHAARWTNLLRASEFRIVLFPSVMHPWIPEFQPYRTIRDPREVEELPPGVVGIIDDSLIETVMNSEADRARGYTPMRSHSNVNPGITPSPESLLSIMKAIRPDLLHSLELQHGAYACLEARRRMGGSFPRWLASSWGSDIYLYRKLPEHIPVLRELFDALDALHSDCARDLDLAVDLGFRGRKFPMVSASGGVDLATYPDPALLPPPSRRDLILIKGNHGWAGRGMNILMAIHRIAPALRRFRLRVTKTDLAVQRTVEAIAREDGLDIRLDPFLPEHSSAIARLAEARLVVGAGISDGATVTLLEAMAVGTFCILSDTTCACEWITPGQTGFTVSPHDVAAIGDVIVRASTDDALVDKASAVNRVTIEERWSSKSVKPVVIQGYHDVMGGVVPRI